MDLIQPFDFATRHGFMLRPYQFEIANFILRNPKCAVFADCGLGKTLSILAAIDQLRQPTLIIAPLRVAKFVWPAEIQKWGFDLTCQVIHGRSKQKHIDKDVDVHVVNPEGLKHVAESKRRWPIVVIDESTTLKNHQSKRWEYATKIVKDAERVILATATPIAGRGHLDLWGQFGLLGEANPFGSWWRFTRDHFSFDIFNRPHLRRGHDKILNQMIEPLVLRKSVEEIPMPIYQEIDTIVQMNAEANRHYGEAELEENSYAPMRSIASGFLYENHWSGERRTHWFNDAKIEAVKELVETGDNLLVFACFTAELDRLRQEFGAGVIDGRTSNQDAETLIQAWNEKTLPMLAMHPRSGGHGLNLQSGGHRIIWFSLPDSGELFQQANGRLYRSGQTNHSVFVHKLIAQHSIDETINTLLSRKCLNEQNLLAEIKGKKLPLRS